MKTSLKNTFIGVFIFFIAAALYPDMSLPIADIVQFIVKVGVLILVASIILKSLANMVNFSTK
ncbi:hypothetical protein [Salinicoccus sp. HZC-1]|uniref:hypothetical protein n=1 Tax=Salinicoccus sp. HZC-1 TaxID=3385497 RepID=UPI00398B5054